MSICSVVSSARSVSTPWASRMRYVRSKANVQTVRMPKIFHGNGRPGDHENSESRYRVFRRGCTWISWYVSQMCCCWAGSVSLVGTGRATPASRSIGSPPAAGEPAVAGPGGPGPNCRRPAWGRSGLDLGWGRGGGPRSRSEPPRGLRGGQDVRSRTSASPSPSTAECHAAAPAVPAAPARWRAVAASSCSFRPK